ncbi:protein of unknown function DUF86 [Desulfotomaculum nigrificans CO-1-SRB]|uniref:Uncharacterized protein n=1 Tax=Desulfotomaculum nigrificans (strain DSM 14880 / VKM B-2319 / CO-1-SRB) TaxID=868595 RepID=F6B5J0_DESCC|nr:HepT-like ribonuclease domain-containing protein [Desulfotomaculum nigrificans]AEF95422.1 protein of unknown function DUF86 [Desulfotomaculum nigrificans CO-1-SRB]
MKDNLIYIQHIMESIQKIEKYLQGLTKEQFFENDSIQDAVIRRFEIKLGGVINPPVFYLVIIPL